MTPDEVESGATFPSTTLSPETGSSTTTLPDSLPSSASSLPGSSQLPDDSFGDSDDLVILSDPDTGEPLDEQALAEIAELLESSVSTTTTSVAAAVVEKEFGVLEGRGRLLLAQIRFLQDNPSLSVLQEGDLVETAGGSESLAPTGIPVGRVANRADRPGSGGPLLDVELNADLNRLNYVRVVLFKPLSEVEQ